ncbi:hypothetical protein OEZ86_002128 [Tetradesmus obliquus]|nr:hypothetical protein OEZ86_002128 [Tetradesmus obliquus]
MEAPVQASNAPAADAVRTHVFAFTLLPLKARNQPRDAPKFITEQQSSAFDENSPLKAGKAGKAATGNSAGPSAGAQQFLQQLCAARSEALDVLGDTASSGAPVQAAVNRYLAALLDLAAGSQTAAAVQQQQLQGLMEEQGFQQLPGSTAFPASLQEQQQQHPASSLQPYLLRHLLGVQQLLPQLVGWLGWDLQQQLLLGLQSLALADAQSLTLQRAIAKSHQPSLIAGIAADTAALYCTAHQHIQACTVAAATQQTQQQPAGGLLSAAAGTGCTAAAFEREFSSPLPTGITWGSQGRYLPKLLAFLKYQVAYCYAVSAVYAADASLAGSEAGTAVAWAGEASRLVKHVYSLGVDFDRLEPPTARQQRQQLERSLDGKVQASLGKCTRDNASIYYQPVPKQLPPLPAPKRAVEPLPYQLPPAAGQLSAELAAHKRRQRHSCRTQCVAGCIFCRIVNESGTAGSRVLYEDELVVALPDHRPAAAQHLLVMPRQHIPNVTSLTAADTQLVRHMMEVGQQLLQQQSTDQQQGQPVAAAQQQQQQQQTPWPAQQQALPLPRRQQQPGQQQQRFKFGFHKPPFRSVDHLHLHCFQLPHLWYRWGQYQAGVNWVTGDQLLDELQRRPSPKQQQQLLVGPMRQGTDEEAM